MNLKCRLLEVATGKLWLGGKGWDIYSLYVTYCEQLARTDRFKVLMFTGKLDSKGHEVYEGDTIRYQFKPCDVGEVEQGEGEVYYDPESAAFLFDRSCEYDFMIPGLKFEVLKKTACNKNS